MAKGYRRGSYGYNKNGKKIKNNCTEQTLSAKREQILIFMRVCVALH
jgi:hypothetical protein